MLLLLLLLSDESRVALGSLDELLSADVVLARVGSLPAVVVVPVVTSVSVCAPVSPPPEPSHAAMTKRIAAALRIGRPYPSPGARGSPAGRRRKSLE